MSNMPILQVKEISKAFGAALRKLGLPVRTGAGPGVMDGVPRGYKYGMLAGSEPGD